MSSAPEMTETSAPSPARWRSARWALLVSALALIPLLPTLRAAFVYDDGAIIRDNALLRGWGSLLRVWSAEYWPIGGSGLYRPVHLALLSIVWNAGDGQAVWFHLYALLLAAFTAVAVWWLVRRGAGAGAAAVAATWFATHPLHVEATASVANSSELLVVLCTIGLVAVVSRSEPGSRIRDAAAVAALSAVALLSKESGVMALPLAAVTAWGWQRAGWVSRSGPEQAGSLRLAELQEDGSLWRSDPGREAPGSQPVQDFVRERQMFWGAGLAAVIAVFVIRRMVLGAGGAHVGVVAPGLTGESLFGRSVIMLSLWRHDVMMMAWPSWLSPYYGPSLIPSSRGLFALAGLAVFAALTAVAIRLARRGDARLLVALAWMVLTWLPASNLLAPTGPLLADRTLFGATVGAALGLAWMVDRLRGRARSLAIAVCLIVATRNAWESAKYARDWTSHRLLWTRLVQNVPAEHLGYRLLGMDARARGDTTQALKLLEHARSLAPTDAPTLFELGQTLYARGRYEEAARALAPLMSNGDALGRRELVAMYLDAVGRARGAPAVVLAATPLMGTRADGVAGEYRRAAQLIVSGSTR